MKKISKFNGLQCKISVVFSKGKIPKETRTEFRVFLWEKDEVLVFFSNFRKVQKIPKTSRV
jgi:hypothetical protein